MGSGSPLMSLVSATGAGVCPDFDVRRRVRSGSMSAWAIIPARGGSKGVPGKNLAPVAGRSLVRRAVEACVEARTIDRVVVSTDDPDIAREAAASGAEVVDRPVELAGDAASSESAVLHALERLRHGDAPLPDVTLLVQCTSPFTTADDLDRLVALTDEFDSVFTAVASHAFLWKRSPSGQIVGVNHDPSRRLPRQQLEPEFAESGNAYAMRTSGFLEHRHRFFGAIGMLEIDESRALEIDTPSDLARARALAASVSAHGDLRTRCSGRSRRWCSTSTVC